MRIPEIVFFFSSGTCAFKHEQARPAAIEQKRSSQVIGSL
jgi:hypothetical protein